MAKVDRIDELPDWFDLDKYQLSESFGAAEWLEQLGRRRSLLDLHPDRRDITQNDSETWRQFTFDFWKAALKEPVQKVRDEPVKSPSKGKITGWMSHADNQPIKPVKVMDLFWQQTRDLEAERNGKAPKGTSKRWDAINPATISVSEFVEHANSPISINYYNGKVAETPIVQIDLGASDSVLKEAFAGWLKGVRNNQPASVVNPRKSLYGRWARYGLLPYLDLLIWGMETESHIPDRIMSAAISRYDAGEANLRKTIAPLAAYLMQDLSELQALAAVQASVRSPANSETFED